MSNVTTNAQGPFRVCLVVDNPPRDLDGLVLIGDTLCKNGCEVFLVPMYAQGYEIPSLRPDFVLLNYARYANESLMRAYHRCGIGIGILDTEGAIWESRAQYAKSIAIKACEQYVHQYYFWGEAQRDILLEYSHMGTNTMTTTGSPRYDYYVEPWIKGIETIDSSFDGHLLFISNFALAYPRFATLEEEIENHIRCGRTESYIKQRVCDERVARNNLIKLIELFSNRYPNLKFVIRTHPFENDDEYKIVFENRDNVHIVRDHAVSSWLKAARLVFHFTSSVAIDATLMKKPIYTLNWLSTNLLREMSPIAQQLSYSIESEDDFKAIIADGHESVDSDSIPNEQAFDTLKQWYYLMDGLSHARVSDQILKFLRGKDISVSHFRCIIEQICNSGSYGDWKSICGGLGRRILGGHHYLKLRQKFRSLNQEAQMKTDKCFSCDQVNKILQRIEKACPNNGDRTVRAFTSKVGESILIKRISD
ncbi:MAG: hypothetical protein KDD48_01050 [Bdellovibrionales bacterium]|nr:hypothetical protein [Bdellovibrionales bacterium]